MLKTGSIIGERYEILKEIGRGGMSIVYLAMDNRLNKSIAVKDIRKRQNSNNEFLMHSLIIESNMLKNLDHGSLPKIYDIIDDSGNIYVVMDYVEGQSLSQKFKSSGPLPEKDVIDWAKQLSNVLGYLHSRKPYPIIYRDMKPDNIMLTPENKIKLIDFGIAREYKVENTTDTTNLGTRAFAAPEQIAGKQTDARTDIYSLGVTLYNLVTGKSLSEPPFEIKPIRTWNPALSEGLEYIIEKCTAAEPENRYQSCEQLSYDLENIDKLTKGYKKKLIRKLTVFCCNFLLLVFFSIMLAMGYKGIYNSKIADYKYLINKSDRYLIDGKYTEAIEVLDEIITEVDGSRAEAYINLINIYTNIRDPLTGLEKVEGYINDKYERINKNNDVLFKVAMTNLELDNPAVALRYFRMVDEKQVPAVEYYKTLTTTMCSMNIDYEKFNKNLKEFEEYTDNISNNENKLSNYNTLAFIYSSYKSELENANDKTIEIIEKASEILKRLDEESLTLRFEYQFHSKLAQAYHSKGINEKDKEAANIYFNKAIENYQILLDIDGYEREEILLKVGEIYTDSGLISQALENYGVLIKDYPNSFRAYIKKANLLLDIEQNKSEGERNYIEAKKAYSDTSKLDGIEEEQEFSKLKRRLNNLGLL